MNPKALFSGAALSALIYGAAALGYAHAANTAITMWNTANPGGAETAIGTDDADLAVSNFGGVTVTLSFVNRGTAPNQITEGNINIDNTTGSVQTLSIIAGANGYLGPADGFTLTGTIGATLGMSDLLGSFFVDGGNTLNGTNFGVVGARTHW